MAAATLTERASLLNDPVLTDKAKGAVVSASVAINFEDPGTANHSSRIAWAKDALADPVAVAPRALHYLIAAAAADGHSQAEILGLDDASFQNYINASVNVLL